MSDEKISLKFHKKDFIVIITLLAATAVLFFGIMAVRGVRDDGRKVIVMIDGKEVKEFSLSKDITYDIISSEGSNVLVIKDRKVYVASADCPDGICAAHTPIEKTDDEIICVPHKVVIVIK